MNTIVAMAMQYLGIYYRWAGNEPMSGLDCSGLVIRVLKDARIMNEDEMDRTANGVYYYLLGKHDQFQTPNKIEAGDILFFGKSVDRITHVAIAADNQLMIHAGSGDSSVHTFDDAQKRDARVKIDYIDYRSDLIAVSRVKNENVKPVWYGEF